MSFEGGGRVGELWHRGMRQETHGDSIQSAVGFDMEWVISMMSGSRGKKTAVVSWVVALGMGRADCSGCITRSKLRMTR